MSDFIRQAYRRVSRVPVQRQRVRKPTHPPEASPSGDDWFRASVDAARFGVPFKTALSKRRHDRR